MGNTLSIVLPSSGIVLEEARDDDDVEFQLLIKEKSSIT
jgi:hypothetical protein